MRRVPVHPLLLGAWPVVALWAGNRTEVFPRDVLPVLGVVLLATIAVWVVAAAGFRNVRDGAIVAAATTVAGQFAGHASEEDMWPALLVTAAAAVVTVTVLALTRRRVRDGVTVFLQVAGLVALVLAALPLLLDAVTRDRVEVAAELEATGEAAAPTRDIVYIIPDRYGRADLLEEVYGIDNQPFLTFLEQRGFQIAHDSLTNYNKTAHAMAAAWNLTYLDDLAARVPDTASGDWGPIYALLHDHRLGEIMTSLGYEYIHIGSWWGPTSDAASADVVLNYRHHSEFAQVYAETTVWPALQQVLGQDAELTVRERVRNHTLFQFDQLERLFARPAERPRFILAHVLVPHEPYVFEPDGSWVPAELERRRSRVENFKRQLAYTNLRLEQLVRHLQDRPEEEHPVILIQADEGPHPVPYLHEGADYHWPSAEWRDLAEKMTILTALYLPGVDVEVPDDLSPVNLFRLVLDAYHGTDLGLLEERSYVFRDEHHLYEFHEVTDRLR